MLIMAFSTSQPSIISVTELANSLSEISQAHAHMHKTGLFHDSYAASRLISFSTLSTSISDPKTLTHASSVFSRIPNRLTLVLICGTFGLMLTVLTLKNHFFFFIKCFMIHSTLISLLTLLLLKLALFYLVLKKDDKFMVKFFKLEMGLIVTFRIP
ncbi:hypothetical protein C5167_036777 [Papaver somniferum]|uniref:Uncharacterized protein n=1 Tax=Papaver somniferum TaxID=3469 RepID=A0A4Y7I871_PAPSO|nr:hypothetical protein C5167_036777 [Papaver somniferum]